MNIALFHGYEIKGSGSNEYTRYLGQFLQSKNDTVHIICRDPNPANYEFLKSFKTYDDNGFLNETIINIQKNIILLMQKV